MGSGEWWNHGSNHTGTMPEPCRNHACLNVGANPLTSGPCATCLKARAK